jgi:hypothetical protein
MTNRLIIAAGVAFALSLSNLHAQNAPGPKGNGQGGPSINKVCPQPECPMGGQGPCGQGMGKGQGGPGKGMGKCDGTGQGMGKGKGPRDGSGPNCPRQNDL